MKHKVFTFSVTIGGKTNSVKPSQFIDEVPELQKLMEEGWSIGKIESTSADSFVNYLIFLYK
ncbi:hypothetical protein [Pedobacter helvus]|uniref:DUF4177 domain-containing protein n=1 Tax=Pedobacter helvus TaxID=2563444 RepID=A0ABW9JQB2_9SPHI|nr:hypothetical protein [Pedobacter ureilyticus]